jgi:hypothetical protein
MHKSLELCLRIVCDERQAGKVWWKVGWSLERAADWGRRDGVAAALRKNLGSASLGKDKEVGGNIGQLRSVLAMS